MIPSAHLELQEIGDLAALIRLEPEWDDLWTRCPNATPFQRPEWLIAWMQTFHPGPLCTLTVRSFGRLIAIAPLYLQQHGVDQVLAPVGAAISDYLDWLVDPEFRQPSFDCILDGLNQLRTSWTSLDFSDIPGQSPLLNLDLPPGYQTYLKFHDACPVLHLPSTLEQLKKIIPTRRWRSVKNARKKIQMAGEAHIELAMSDTLDEILESLFRLHRARWSTGGQAGVLSDRDVQDFHRRVTPALLRKGVLRLYALRFNSQIIGVLYALFEKEIAYCYLQGFDPQFADFSPGAQVLAAVIEDAVHHRKRAVDFLRGQEAYKYAWGARDVPTYRLQIRRTLPLHDFTAKLIAA